MDWIDVAQEMDKSQAVVNAVMNFLVPKKAGNFLTISSTERPLFNRVSQIFQPSTTAR